MATGYSNGVDAGGSWPDDTDQLGDLVRLGAESLGLGEVSLHLAAAGNGVLDLRAVSSRQITPPPSRALRRSAPLVARVLKSTAPVVTGGTDPPAGPRVLAGWDCADTGVAGILSVHLERGAAPLDVSALRRVVAVARLLQQAVVKMTQAQNLEAANAKLRSRTQVQRRYAAVSLRGGSLSAVVRECAAITGKSVILFDSEGRQMFAAGGPPGLRLPALSDILASCHPAPMPDNQPVVAGPTGLSRRKIVVPVAGAGERFGWLVLDEYPHAFHGLDRYSAQQAATYLGTEFVVQRRVARVVWNAKSSLARQMIRGTQSSEDLVASAEYQGVDLGARRVLVYVLDPERRRTPSQESLIQTLAEKVERKLGTEVLATRGSEGIVLLIEASPDHSAAGMVHVIKDVVTAATGQLCGEGLIAGVSTVCEPTGLSRGYREAREVALCIDRFASHAVHRVLAVTDLGPARLFLANSESSAVRDYVTDVLGPLLTGDPRATALLVTLQCYFDHSRSVRASAAELGVHENTIRLRLARVTTATGLDVAGDANDQLSVQTALLVLRLQGHPVLRQFTGHRTDFQESQEARTA